MNLESLVSKTTAVDTFAMVSYGAVVGTFIEGVVIGLDGIQVLKSRCISVAVNSCLGGAYGRYYDYWMGKTNDKESGLLKKSLIDMAVYSSFWTPIYALWLYCIGADSTQIKESCLLSACISPLLGPTTNWYIDKVRGMTTNKKGDSPKSLVDQFHAE